VGFANNGFLHIGRGNNNNGSFFDGFIDEVRISGCALDRSQFLLPCQDNLIDFSTLPGGSPIAPVVDVTDQWKLEGVVFSMQDGTARTCAGGAPGCGDDPTQVLAVNSNGAQCPASQERSES